MRCYDSRIGPYDSVIVVVKSDGVFSLLVYDQQLKEGIVTTKGSSAFSDLVLVLDKLANAQIVVCVGISNYSEIQSSIGYDVRRVVPVFCPPDSVRDIE